LAGNISFMVNVDGGQLVSITVAEDTTAGRSVANLIDDLNDALFAARIAGDVVTGQDDGRITFSRATLGAAVGLAISFSGDSWEQLGFASGQTQAAAGRDEAFLQHFACYQAKDDVEQTVFDTRAGNDMVRADAGYKFPLPGGEGMIDSEWGIAPGDLLDGSGSWQRAIFDLSDAVGHSVRLRFEFDTVDAFNNAFEGWYLDDVTVRAIEPASPDVSLTGDTGELFPVSLNVAGFGDFNGDMIADFTMLPQHSDVISTPSIFIYYGRDSGNPLTSGGISARANVRITHTELTGFEVRGAGDLNRDGRDELIINGTNQAFVLLGRTGLAGTHTLSSLVSPSSGVQIDGVARLTAAGDVDNDMRSALAADSFISVPAVDEESSLVRRVGQVFLGGADFFSDAAWFSKPDLVFERAQPVYTDIDPAIRPDLVVRPFGFASVGLINDDTNRDFVVAEIVGRQSRLHFGHPLLPAQPATIPTQLVESEPFEFKLAVPLASSPASAPRLDILDANPAISNAPSLEGSQVNEHLQNFQAVGDFNGDGFDDWLIGGKSVSYILAGPIPPEQPDDVTNHPRLVIDHNVLGRPADACVTSMAMAGPIWCLFAMTQPPARRS
jgi:hypothetical protein